MKTDTTPPTWWHLTPGPATPKHVRRVRFCIEERKGEYRMHLHQRSPRAGILRAESWRPIEGFPPTWGPIPKAIRHLTGDALTRALVTGNSVRFCRRTGMVPSDKLSAYTTGL